MFPPGDSPRLLFSREALDTVMQVLQARLQSLEDEILRLVKLASETDDRKVQQTYLDLAQDLQKDAREVRTQVAKFYKVKDREQPALF